MTLQDLYDAVAQLGFEDSLEDGSNGRFIHATNRALIEINALRPRRARVSVNHRVPRNLLFDTPTQIEKLDEEIVFMAMHPKSFYFEVCGNGNYEVDARYVKFDEDGVPVKDEDGKIIEGEVEIDKGTFDRGTFEEVKGIITLNDALTLTKGEAFTGEVFIKFAGEFAYTVRNIALYDRIYSDDDKDIPPFRSHIPYNIKNYTEDFDHFDASPFEASDGKYLNGDYAIEGSNTILLPIGKTGTYTLCYIHKVKTYDRYQRIDTSEIDLDADLAALMPILVASYVWLDDEPEKSQYYFSLYTQRAAQIQRESKDLNPVTFQSVYGW
jgi:hypothetical protein